MLMLLTVAGMFFSPAASAATYVVRPGGSGDNATIQVAINAATIGDIIELAVVDVNGNVSEYALLTPSGTVDVPANNKLEFTLSPVRPNPTSGGRLEVRFSLPTAAPAKLMLIDVTGRQIAERQFTSAGPQTVNLADQRHISPGLYFVRLTQGANSRSTRVVVTN